LQEADLVICRRSRPVLVLHERKTRITLMTRLAGKTAGETVAAMMATFRRLDPRMRGSITFDKDTCFARHTLLRGMLSATTYFCDAYASWQKGGIENANSRIRRWLPRGTDLDTISEDDIQDIAMTINPLPGRGFMETSRRSPLANASATDPRSRRSCPSLAGTWKSGSLEPLRFTLESTRSKPPGYSLGRAEQAGCVRDRAGLVGAAVGPHAAASRDLSACASSHAASSASRQ
jgi:hypothetical protein